MARDPRTRVVTVVAIIVAVVGGLAALIYVREASPPWHSMNGALDSFPVPDGYRPVPPGREREGGCLLSPTCQTAKVFEMWAPGGAGSPPTCADAQAAATAWVRSGAFRETSGGSGPCSFGGVAHGRPAEVQLVTPYADVPTGAIRVLVFRSDTSAAP
jgi:hypothetical protein